MKLQTTLTLFALLASTTQVTAADEAYYRQVAGSRPLSAQALIEIDQEKLLEEAYSEEFLEQAYTQEILDQTLDQEGCVEMIPEEEGKSDEEKISKSQGALYPRKFSGSHHWISGRTPDGFELDLEDGSKWNAYPADGIISSNWLMSDDLVLEINKDKGKNTFPYKIKNLDRKSSVRVQLSWGPYVRGLYSFEIIDIDYNSNAMIVMDGSGFTNFIDLSRWDKNVTKYWMLGDQVVVGVNNDWLKFWNPYFFLNVETLTHARGSL